MKKSYYAIIPANVRYNENLTANSKLLYGEITSLCNEKGYCWASNSYFSELYNVSKTSISKWISQLKKEGFIKIKVNYKEGTKEILNRYISLVQHPIEENLNTPIEENLKDNTKFNNTKVNNIIYSENQFLERWKDARKHYDKKPTNITKLDFHIKQTFKELKGIYSDKDFDIALTGFFSQKTYPSTRIKPNHFIENFEQYLTCGQTGEKLFEKDKKQSESPTSRIAL